MKKAEEQAQDEVFDESFEDVLVNACIELITEHLKDTKITAEKKSL